MSSSEPSPSVLQVLGQTVRQAAQAFDFLLKWTRKGLIWLKTKLPRHDHTIKEAIEEVLEEHEDQADKLPQQEKTMLHNVLQFAEISVQDIMIPRTEIVAVPEDIDLPNLKKHILEQRHTRIPIFTDTLDHVHGFLHIKDVIPIVAGDKPFEIKSVMRPMLFVPPSMKVIDLLLKMRHSGSHMAIVVDEYGGTDGLVTLEDLFEEIVGDIQDEHDDEEQRREIIRLSEHVIEADARVRVDLLERELGLDLVTEKEDEEEFETLGGLIFFELGRVPKVGEKINYASGIVFEIMEANPRRIQKVRILKGV